MKYVWSTILAGKGFAKSQHKLTKRLRLLTQSEGLGHNMSVVRFPSQPFSGLPSRLCPHFVPRVSDEDLGVMHLKAAA